MMCHAHPLQLADQNLASPKAATEIIDDPQGVQWYRDNRPTTA